MVMPVIGAGKVIVYIGDVASSFGYASVLTE